MNVVQFPLKPANETALGWQGAEVQRLMSASAAYLANGQGSTWEFGETERGDPQFYLLGPGPEQECVLSISRLGRLYVLEDGNGHVIFEHDNLMLLAEQAATALRHKKQAILAQLAVAWYAMREFYEEKIEPAMAEPVEVLSHFAPQLAALV
jgi:hypothetical protein